MSEPLNEPKFDRETIKRITKALMREFEDLDMVETIIDFIIEKNFDIPEDKLSAGLIEELIKANRDYDNSKITLPWNREYSYTSWDYSSDTSLFDAPPTSVYTPVVVYAWPGGYNE